jgi:diaminopimelate decarboxylase
MDTIDGRLAGRAGFSREGDLLCLDGVPLTLLAERVGSTPFFAYVRDAITARVKQLREALPDGVHLHYAIKANPMPAVVQHLAGLVDGFDLASGGELRIALDTTMPAEHISFAGPGKTAAELRQAAAAGVTLCVESFSEIRALAGIGGSLGLRPSVVVRVNPDFELRSAGMHMGGGPKPFGIDAEQVPDALREIASLPLEFRGFQMFCGSQNLNAAAIVDAQRKIIDLAMELARHAPAPVRLLNMGGGFGIPYFPGDAALDLAQVGSGLEALLPAARSGLPEARLVVELGRYLVGEAGVYVCRVIDRKVSRGKVFLVTDGGLHHHLAASGNFGQVVRRNYPVAIGNRMSAPVEEAAEIVGCLCTPIDVLARNSDLPAAQIGDLVVVFQSGAYGRSASPLGFLSHPEPAEIMV